MSQRLALMVWLLLALSLLTGAGLYLGRNLERYEKTVDEGPSPEARAKPWLAAEHFLRGRSVEVTTTDTLALLPDPNQRTQTLLLFNDRAGMTPAQTEQLLNWVTSGGHLLFVAEQLWDEQKGRSGDLLLDRLQIRQYLSKDINAQDQQLSDAQPMLPIPLMTPVPKRKKTPWPELTRLYLENERAPAYMSFDPAFHLEDPQDHAQSWANSADATHLLQISRGKGLITVVTDADLWKTHSIGEHDNAWLLWYLTQDSKVTMVLETDHDTLLTLLLRNFPQALLALALLIGLGLWHVALREGPLRKPASLARRQLTEHLRASAEFLRRRSGQQTLLKSLQQDILRRARQLHPGFERLVIAEQWQVLSRLTRLPTSAISDALRPRPPQRLSHSEFTRQVAQLQTLRNAL
ncbi:MULTISPECIES: DUF4350 domain-containing protein [Pseudomonas syringae group]|uniref:DUF4350 domain-containing protein n=2 Tax=Pseudomonas syringae group TaxID=136849 RepID=A0ABY1UEJ9_PSESX|nr:MULTISPECIES: DUF4350 domain-containing protein [Pseudomonas syringae group]KWT11564.1 hypothetical protein AL046_15935 [Pseudomonas syringae pv. avii]POQ07935.1 DUF4350 domain-containing protein [Pseudomonas syringae pv. avii]SOQ13050.1 Hypothetical protein CFBP1573P_04329 [Pseudomonas syringae pv. persicae]SOQ13139.1 Hypothetical protein NCPPB2254_04268 [Pseudomonas syringae pv. persicae]SOS28718.1 hypothetical protein CFBP3846_04324 [Pseudomonas syringae pv. avii]